MSLYSALPPAQGQSPPTAGGVNAAPTGSTGLATSRAIPPRLFPLRPSIPSIPRALLNRPSQPIKPNLPPPSSLPSPAPAAPATQLPTVASATQLLLAELEAADGGEDGDADLQQALETLADVYQPRKPNEWQQYVAWKEQREAAVGEAEAELSRKRAAEQLREDDDGDEAQHSKRQQRSFHYAYQEQTERHDSPAVEKQPPTATPTAALPQLAAVSAAPLVDKQAMLSVSSGEDAYMRRMRMSSQPAAAVNAANDTTSESAEAGTTYRCGPAAHQLATASSASSTAISSFYHPFTIRRSIRVILLTVVYYCLLTQHSTSHAQLGRCSVPAVPPPRLCALTLLWLWSAGCARAEHGVSRRGGRRPRG